MQKTLTYKKWKEYYKSDLKNIIDIVKNYINANNLHDIINLSDEKKFITFLYINSSKYKYKYL